jgi:phosphatidylglycerophosphate synthase
MSDRAVVYLPDPSSRQAAAFRIAGRPVLFRTLMTLVRAGIRRIGLPGSLRGDASDLLRSDDRLRSAIVWLDSLPDAERIAWAKDPLLLVPVNVLLDPSSIGRVLNAPGSSEGIALEESKGTLSPVLLTPPDLVALLWDRLAPGLPLGEELDIHLRQNRVSLVPGGGFMLPVTDAVSRRHAESTLYRSLGTEADSRVDLLINRRCSRVLTRLLVRFPVTPNQVSLTSLALGLSGAWGFWWATPTSALLGLILYMLAVVFDHSDGEIARLTFQESAFGEWLDFSIDTLIHTLLVLGMGFTAQAVGGRPAVAAGAMAAFGVLMSALFARLLSREENGERRLAGLLRSLGNRDLFYLVLGAFIGSLWLAPQFLPLLVWILAVGSQAYWLACLARRERKA